MHASAGHGCRCGFTRQGLAFEHHRLAVQLRLLPITPQAALLGSLINIEGTTEAGADRMLSKLKSVQI